MKHLNRGFVILMVAVFVMSMAPLAFAPDLSEKTVSSDLHVKTVQVGKPQLLSADVRLSRCVSFLSKNNLDDTPRITCARLLKKELNCIEFLKSKGVDDAVSKCDGLLKTVRVVTNKVTPPNTGVDIAQRRLFTARRIATASGDAKFVDNLPEGKADIFARLPRAEQKKILTMDAEERLKKINSYRLEPVKKNMLYKKRVIAKAKLNAAKQKYVRAKNEYIRINRIYNQKKELFLETKEKLKKCEGQDTEGCNELRKQALEHAKEYVINGAKMAIEHLEKIKSSVESAEGMDEERAAEIVGEIDKAISDLETAIEKAENAETKEEVQEAAKEISQVWKKIKHAQKVHVARVVHSGMWNIIKKSEQLGKRMDDALARMEENGIEVDDIDAKVEKFSEKISAAKDKHARSEELIREARKLKTDNPDENEIKAVSEQVSQARETLAEAHNDIKDAYKLFVQILRDIHTVGGRITPQSDAAGEEGLASDEVYEVVDTTVEDSDDSESEESEDTSDAESGSGEDDDETVTAETVQLSEIEDPNCWADKPDYTPGSDKGYFIWQGKCANFWWVDWSGDTKDDLKKLLKCIQERRNSLITTADNVADDIDALDEALEIADEIIDEASDSTGSEITGEVVDAPELTNEQFCTEMTLEEFRELRRKLIYPVSGTITSNGKIFDVGVRRFDGYDKLKFMDNEIEFKARVGPHFDGLFFRTAGDKVKFELSFDGETGTELVYIGKDETNPETNPFELEGIPSKKPPVCSSGQIIHNKRCVNRVKNKLVKADGIE